MSVTVAINSLVSLGISSSDIACIYGAARKVGTWVKAQWNDLQLLGFLQVEKEDILKRKGMIDIDGLNERWGKTLTIMAKGQKTHYKSPNSRPIIPNNDSFT